MIFVPLPFVVAVILAIVLVQLVRRSDQGLWGNRFFILLIAAYALQSILIGIRWGYDLRSVLPAQSILATFIASLAWVSFKSLTVEQPTASRPLVWPHTLPSALVLALLVFWREPVGVVITLIFLSYGAALLWLVRQGPDALVSSRLDGAVLSYRSLQFTAIALIASASTDVVISFDLAWTGGAYSGAVVAFANVVALLALGGAASVASLGQGAAIDHAEGMPPGEEASRPTEEDASVAASIDRLMQSRWLYKDAELNLGRIARRLNLPARRVSLAVNRFHGVSVSQYVNDYRIKEACRLLTSTEDPVTRIMFEAGFISKSNFNREFLRVAGVSPTIWRQGNKILDSAPLPSPN